MIEAQSVSDTESGVSPASVLAAAKSRRRVADRAEAELLAIACDWADLHPPESIHDAASFSFLEHEEQIAGPGCPLVAEFCLPELGAVLGISTPSAKHLVGQALELRHRLPRLWTAVHAGQVPVWRARRVAEATIHADPPLSVEAAGWVDHQVVGFAHRCGVAQVDRLVAEAIARFGPSVLPDDPDDPDPPHSDRRHVSIEGEQVDWAGTLRISAELDLADAHDLDHALRHGAEALKALGSTEPVGARRAMALGHLARHQLALDLHHHTTGHAQPEADIDTADDATAGARRSGDGSATRGWDPSDDRLPAARQVVLHVHLYAAATGTGTGVGGGSDVPVGPDVLLDPLARLEEGQRLVLLDQVKNWCAATHTQVSIKPVIDTAENRWAPGYAIPDRIRDQIVLRDRTCVFPWCSRPARRCQVDHIVPFDHHADTEGRPQPGPTQTDNLACLCAQHHRLKTHGRWRYRMTAPGVFEWTSPNGYRFRRDHTGSSATDPPHRP